MNDNTKDIISIFGTALGGAFVVTIIIMTVVYLFDNNIACPRYGKNVNLEYKYDFWAGGCFVDYQGQWIPSKSLRAGKLD